MKPNLVMSSVAGLQMSHVGWRSFYSFSYFVEGEPPLFHALTLEQQQCGGIQSCAGSSPAMQGDVNDLL